MRADSDEDLKNELQHLKFFLDAIGFSDRVHLTSLDSHDALKKYELSIDKDNVLGIQVTAPKNASFSRLPELFLSYRSLAWTMVCPIPSKALSVS